MAHVVTQACCGDASCVFACPVNAIHPTPDEPDFGLAEMLYIDPVSCVDCGACVTACPLGAIAPQDKLAPDQVPFVEINALFHREPRTHPPQAPVTSVVPKVVPGVLRVAIVGAGPAALYAADELLKRPAVEVTVLDRLPTPYGLVRAGVAPDHTTTKTIDRLFRQIEDQAGFTYALGVEIGTDLSHAELLDHHHAVIYATGASRDRALDVPGEGLPGSETATAFVAWYNGHPDHADTVVDLDTERVVIVGNGNVALDVARILTAEPSTLAATDIADHALHALRRSQVREVVLLGRRGVTEAAFTLPELVGLVGRDGVDIVVEGADLDEVTAHDPMASKKIEVLAAAHRRPARPGARRIVFRFGCSPVEMTGGQRVERLTIRRNRLLDDGTYEATDLQETLETSLVLRAIGYRGAPTPGVPFDETTATMPNTDGRVIGTARTYAVGWVKRGPNGFIGTNKTCAQETVDRLMEDWNAGGLAHQVRPAAAFTALVSTRRPTALSLTQWRAINAHERRAGASDGRPRRKLVRETDMLRVVEPALAPRRRLRDLMRR
jgi:ferredoxin--NADP+ reductase